MISRSNIHDIPIPERFKESLRNLHEVDTGYLLDALEQEPVVSFKINRRKLSPQQVEILGYDNTEPVEWCRSGFYLAKRPKFTLNPLLHAGVFYVQEAASMIYETLVSDIISDLPDGPILDLCAAPGGKTTSIINALPDESRLVVANEYNPQRANILAENIIKWSYPNVIVTNAPVSAYGKMKGAFSLIAVDAPCSGEGMMRKEPVARNQWSTGLVTQCTMLQKEILDEAVEALAPGGFLIYSTCTFNRTENEDNINRLIEFYNLETVTPPRRFIPGRDRSEGLFCCMLRKAGNASGASPEKLRKLITRNCRILCDGIPMNKFPTVEVELEEALRYLRREALQLPSDIPRGFVTVNYKGFRLGEVKNLGNRANNLYPKEWRIRNV